MPRQISRLCSVFILLVFAGLTSPPTTHGFELPKGLTESDRREVVRTIGLNSAPKALSNPYPLGGYSGFEVGYSVEFVNVRDIRRIGCEPGSPGCSNLAYSNETEWRYARLSVGKGLYRDVDVFFSFMPPTGNMRASDYGAQIRWSFYQAEFLPISLSTLAYFNHLNFDDTFMNRNLGLEVIAGVTVNNFSLYFGGGWVEARGTFIGRAGPPTNTCNEDCTLDPNDPKLSGDSRTVTETVPEAHTVVGVSLHYQNLFAAAQVDRYRDAVYSMKVGLRF